MNFLLLLLLLVFVGFLVKKKVHIRFDFYINNKVRIFMICFGALLGVLSILFYIQYEEKGYYYGQGSIFYKKNILYGITPQQKTDYPQEFVLLDKDGFELIGKGFRYKQTSFKIEDILGYGYNDTSLMLKCTDSLHNIRFLVSYKTGKEDANKLPTISFKDINSKTYHQIKNTYNWIEIDKEKANTIRVIKLISIVGFIFSLFLIIRFTTLKINNK